MLTYVTRSWSSYTYTDVYYLHKANVRNQEPPQPGDSRPVMSPSQRVLSRQMMRTWEIWNTNMRKSNNTRMIQKLDFHAQKNISTLLVNLLTQDVLMVLLSRMVRSRKWSGTKFGTIVKFTWIDQTLLFLHAHREASALANELPEELDQFRFLHDTYLTNLKGSVGLILGKHRSWGFRYRLICRLDRLFLHHGSFVRDVLFHF